MLDIGWPELLVVAIVLILVVGPKDLPRMLRNFGRTTKKVRSMANDFRKQFDDALKEAELDDVKSFVDDARSLNPKNAIRKELSSLDSIGRDIESDLRKSVRPNSEAAKTGEPASRDARPAAPAKGAVETESVDAEARSPASNGDSASSDKPAKEGGT